MACLACAITQLLHQTLPLSFSPVFITITPHIFVITQVSHFLGSQGFFTFPPGSLLCVSIAGTCEIV